MTEMLFYRREHRKNLKF